MVNIYNEEVKNRYLETYVNEGTQLTIKNIFTKSVITEETLNKDLYNFSTDDIADVFRNISPKSLAIAMSIGRFLKQYLTWSITNGYRDNNDNPLNGVDREWYSQFVNKKLKIHYSYDEFIDLLEDDNMLNAQDQSLLFLFFEGVSGERFSEIQALKFSDIDWENNTIYIKERDKKISVSEDCIKYLDKANKQNTYFQYNMKTKEFTEKELLPSEFIFKNVKSPRATEGVAIGMSVLYNRIHALKELLDLEYLTPNALKQSGMIKMAVDIYKEEGILGYDQLSKVGEKYNFSTITNQGYTYFNTFLMKDFLNEESIKDLYDIDVEFAKK